MESDAAVQPRPPREVVAVLVGLMLGLFATVSSSMVVANALPAIADGLGTTSAGAIWVVLASLVTMTVATPVWGKLADHADKKRLTQASLAIFVIGSVGAALAPDIETLIAARAVQGVATGGLLAMSQAVLGAVTTPRQRGAYAGYLGAVMSVATLCGPLLGGVIVDAPGLGWRWCFVLLLPLAVAAVAIVQATLHLPQMESAPDRPRVRVDVAGAVLIAVAGTALVVWITMAGSAFPWLSAPSLLLLGAVLGATVALVIVERRVPDPILDPLLFRHRAVRWAIVGTSGLGLVMFSSILFLSQYLQLAREHSASTAGLLALPMLAATTLGSIAGGTLVARTGRLATVLVVGAVLLTAGFAVMAAIRPGTPDALVVAATVPVGLGIGALMQNLVLAAQNAVDRGWVGRVSAALSLFRSLAGAAGVAALGELVVAVAGPAPTPDGQAIATGAVFMVATASALVCLVAVIALGRQRLRTTI